jgi:hypothetical protein
MRLLNNIIFFILAALILILGYFIGSIILIIIFSVIILMTLFFILSWILNNFINITKNKKIKFFLKYIFTSIITIILLSIFWKLLKINILDLTNPYKTIFIIWSFCAIIFGTFWFLIKSTQSNTKYNKSLNMYTIENYKYNLDNKINYLDILLIVITVTIIAFVFNNLYFII